MYGITGTALFWGTASGPGRNKNVESMAENQYLPQSRPPQAAQFMSLRERCLGVLKNAKASCGRTLPLTACEIAQRLQETGFAIKQGDIEGLLRELSEDGSIQEIDPTAGFRWVGEAA